VCEGAWPPRGKHAGRAYLAVDNALDDRAVMARLASAKLPCALDQIHPKPIASRTKRARPRSPRAARKGPSR